MATPKFDRILQEFSRRIGDRLVSSFTPGNAYPEGTILSAAMAISYVNRGMVAYMNDALFAVQGNQIAFLGLMPELISPLTTVAFTSGVHTIVNPNLHYFDFVGGIAGSAQITRQSPVLLDLFLAGKYPLHPPTVDKPFLISVKNKLYIFPTSITTANILFITQPIDGTTGNFIAQNGSVDSPFYEIRNSAIAEKAEKLYWDEKLPGRNA